MTRFVINCLFVCISFFCINIKGEEKQKIQEVIFFIQPKDYKKIILFKDTCHDYPEIFGSTNADGSFAKFIPLGTYIYKIISENYFPYEGCITLSGGPLAHKENVTLRPRFSQVTLTVDGDAEIYVNGERKGTGSWNGPLNAGIYNVECKLTNCRSSSQSIMVEENVPRVISLIPPTPIVGNISVLSNPLGASIKVDGKDYGTTPCNITGLLIGQHKVSLCLNGYDEIHSVVEVKELETTDVSLTMKEMPIDKTITVKGVSFVMKCVEGGTFQMGSNDGDSDEKPVHSATLGRFYIGQTEVTQALWNAVMGATIRQQRDKAYSRDISYKDIFGNGKNYPMCYISWDDCQEFITKLNQLTGQKFRMPTEAEWEFAARGGNKSGEYEFSGSNKLDDVAWYYENIQNIAHPVATKQPNELGLYDMSGSVSEWCHDWYGDYPSSSVYNPTGPSSGLFHVIRGGSWCWYNHSKDCRVANRSNSMSRHHDVGLRLAMSE